MTVSRGVPREIASLGLVGVLGMAVSGWAVVGFEWLTIRVVGDSFAMIIVAPLLMILAFLVGLAGLAAAVMGIVVVAGASTKPPNHQALTVAGELVSIALNIGYVWALVRVLG